MTKEQIEAVFERVRDWPAEWQEDAADMLLKLEEGFENPFELTEEEIADLDAAIAEADRGEFVPDEVMKAFFAKCSR